MKNQMKNERYYTLKYIKWVSESTESETKIFTQRERDVLAAMFDQLYKEIEKGSHIDEFQILREEFEDLKLQLTLTKLPLHQKLEISKKLFEIIPSNFMEMIEKQDQKVLVIFREINEYIKKVLLIFDN